MKPGDADRSLILDELMDCVDSVVLVVDRRLRVVEANRAASVFFGYAVSELIAKSLASLVAAEERERIMELCRSAKERRGGRTVLVTRLKKSFPARFSVSPIAGTAGKPRYALLVARLGKDGRSARGDDPSNGLAERMLRGFADPVFVVDGPSRTISDCNDAAVAAFGFSRAELIGRRLLDHLSFPGSAQRARTLEARADKTYATSGIYQEPILFPRKGAPPLPCYLTGLPFFKPDGSLDIIIAILFDRSREEDNKAELAELVDRVRAFASDFASMALASSSSARGRAKRLSDLGFTSRQVEIARLCAAGISSKEIGYSLGITESTVKNHLAAMYRKLGVHSRMGFARALSAKRIRIE